MNAVLSPILHSCNRVFLAPKRLFFGIILIKLYLLCRIDFFFHVTSPPRSFVGESGFHVRQLNWFSCTLANGKFLIWWWWDEMRKDSLAGRMIVEETPVVIFLIINRRPFNDFSVLKRIFKLFAWNGNSEDRKNWEESALRQNNSFKVFHKEQLRDFINS